MPTRINPTGISKLNTKIATKGEGADKVVTYTLYSTVIATYRPFAGTVILTTGGYNTPTTIRRMNECLRHWGFKASVSSKDLASGEVLIQSSTAQI